MGAKAAKKHAKTSSVPPPVPVVPSVSVSTGQAPADATPAWLDSTDPRKRRWGKIALAAVWMYVAALWLLALDQTLRWGIFGPQLPPTP